MKVNKIVTLVMLISVVGSVSAQLPSSGMSTSGVLDGVYVKEHIPTKRVIQYTHLREADIIWAKRVWRTIDLREKKNHPLMYPTVPISDRRSLWDVIKYGITEERSLTPYEATDEAGDPNDQFDIPITPANGNVDDPAYKQKIQELFYDVSTEAKLDDEGEPIYDEMGNTIDTTIYTPIMAEQIVKYVIKEDWFFDKQRGVQERRIIGIAPVIYSKDENGDVKGFKTCFWLYFPECRYVFQNFFVYNTHNDTRRMSFDDLFWKHDYSSYIHKESNVFDRKVSATWEGVDALLESEKIKKVLFTIEHDLGHL